MVTSYKKTYNVAVIGASGNAGSQIIHLIGETGFPVNNIYAIASQRSKGSKIRLSKDRELLIKTIDEVNPKNVDLAFFCAGSGVSSIYVPEFTSQGVVVIDKTSYFRFHPQVPLIIPEINGNALEKGMPLGVVSNPNCVVIPLSMTLDALQRKNKVKRVIISTYQSVSGAGKSGVSELHEQTTKALNAEDIHTSHFRKQIAFNVIPAIGSFKTSGATDEEEKISSEALKILGKNVKVFATCVRVPVFLSHSISVVVELDNDISPYEAADLFSDYQGIVVVDNPENNLFITPIDAQHQDTVFVSRIRRDHTRENSIAYWISCDNLRKGAALNGIQIAKSMIKVDPTLQRFKRRI